MCVHAFVCSLCPVNVVFVSCVSGASPLPELLEHDAVGEALAADPDPLQDPVTAELVQHQVGVQLTRLQRGKHQGSDLDRTGLNQPQPDLRPW